MGSNPTLSVIARDPSKCQVEVKVLRQIWKYLTKTGEHHNRSAIDRLKNA